MSETLDCAIVGAGIAGLSAAYELSRRGVDFKVFEGSERIGGFVRTERVNGFTIDQGPDSLLAQKPAALDLCRELGLGDRLIATSKPRVAYVLREKVLHPLPEGSVLGIPVELGPLMASSLFSAAGKTRIAAEPSVPPRQGSAEESIGHFVRRRFGDEAADYIAEPLLAGIHAGDVDRLSVDALFPQLPAAERQHGSVIRAFRTDVRPRDPDGAFRSLAGGLGELIDALASVLPPGSVELGSPIIRLETNSAYHLGDGRSRTFAARSIILATPTYATSRLLKTLDGDLAELLSGIRYASSVAVALGYPRSRVGHGLGGSGFVVPKIEGLALLAVTWTSSKWPGRAPPNHALLRGYISDLRSPEVASLDDSALVERVITELTPVLDIRGDPVLSRVYRWPRANAQYEVGHLARVRSIEDRTRAHPGLFLTGSGLRGVGIPDCVADARATARQAAGWLEHTASPRSLV